MTHLGVLAVSHVDGRTRCGDVSQTSPGAPAAVLPEARGALSEDGAGAGPHHSAQRVEEPREGVEGDHEPRGDVVQVQRHIVEQLADGAPRLPTLDVPVPQMVDQPVALLARFDLPVPEQVIEVPKISCPPRFSRTALRSPRKAEQLVEVPLPAREVQAWVRDANGQRWSRVWDSMRRIYWWLLDSDNVQWDASPGRYINTGQG